VPRMDDIRKRREFSPSRDVLDVSLRRMKAINVLPSFHRRNSFPRTATHWVFIFLFQVDDLTTWGHLEIMRAGLKTRTDSIEASSGRRRKSLRTLKDHELGGEKRWVGAHEKLTIADPETLREGIQYCFMVGHPFHLCTLQTSLRVLYAVPTRVASRFLSCCARHVAIMYYSDVVVLFRAHSGFQGW
jgi:hypothetical protein